MSASSDSHAVALELPERIITQLDTLIRHGHFADRQAAIVAAVERLYKEEPHMTARQEAVARLCGALHLGTTRQSLRDAELDRLASESGHR